MKRLIICISLFLFSSLADAASFDCTKASTATEKTICTDNQISTLDSQLMETYKKALSETSNADDVKADQKTWLSKTRNKCPDAECIKQAYLDRIAKLSTTAIEKAKPEIAAAPSPANAVNQQPENAPVEAGIIKQNDSTTTDANAPQQQTQSTESAVSVPPASNINVSSENDVHGKPPSTISDVSSALAGVIGLLLIVGMIKPAWLLRTSEKPNRVKILIYLVPILILFSGITALTRTDARKAYDTKLNADQKVAEQANKAQTSIKNGQQQQQITAQPVTEAALKDMCTKGTLYVIAYMDAMVNKGGDTSALFSNMEIDIGEYPAAMQDVTRKTWKSMIQKADSGVLPGLYVDSSRADAANQLGRACMKAVSNSLSRGQN